MSDVDTFAFLMEYLREYPSHPVVPHALTFGPHRRLFDALEELREGTSGVGALDLTGLVRHVLRTECELQKNGDLFLAVPKCASWPTAEDWESSGAIVSDRGEGFCIQMRPWAPAWLTGIENTPIDCNVYGYAERRKDARLDADPFFSGLFGEEFKSYKSFGQRAAIRSVMSMKSGGTLIVNIPTGSGKSMVSYVTALASAGKGSVCVCVVPTVSLAMDQERAFRNIVQHSPMSAKDVQAYAYHADTDKGLKETIRKRIRNGRQIIVFTSPESLFRSLAPALYKCTEEGYLTGFIIDEAHIVAEWGNDFRSDFQALSGLRQDLLNVADQNHHRLFKTLLLTATMTADCFEMLASLFGTPGPLEQVSSVVLRPETEYRVAKMESEDIKKARILETLHHMPRPVILYLSTPIDVDNWTKLLCSEGFSRVIGIRGGATAEHRLAAVEGVRTVLDRINRETRSRIDIVVANSAFGLGVDIPDIRTVIHACLPETIDRFYQEVGRGGRDGFASCSILLYTEADIKIARNLNRTTLISVDRGFERWEAMLATQSRVNTAERTVLRVSLTAKPADIPVDSTRNQAWNLRTLTLMSRSGLIRMESERPPIQEEGGRMDEDAYARRYEEYLSSKIVRIIDPDVSNKIHWNGIVQNNRRVNHDTDKQLFELMLGITNATHCYSEILCKAYSIHRMNPVNGEPISVFPQSSCGGCPSCRKECRVPFTGIELRPGPLLSPQHTLTNKLASLMSPGRVLFILYDPTQERWKLDADQVLQLCIRHGVRNIVAPRAMLNRQAFRDSYLQSPEKYTFCSTTFDDFRFSRLPTLLVLEAMEGSEAVEPETEIPLSSMGGLMILAPRGTRDPQQSEYMLAQRRHPNMTPTTFSESL